jgi:hypothetical protein
MTELSIPVRMIVAFLNLSIALQAVVLFVKKLGERVHEKVWNFRG